MYETNRRPLLSRTDRGIIVFALFLLVFAICEHKAYDYLVFIRDAGVNPARLKRFKPVTANVRFDLNSLVFSAPKFPVRYSHSDFEEVEFTWGYLNKKQSGSFVFEISGDPSFKSVLASKETGQSKITLRLRFPATAYYRVKDSEGRYSEIHQLSLLKSTAPSIAFTASANGKSILNLKLTPESRATIQLARDPEFQQIYVTRKGVDSNYGFDLPAGKYFARARLEYRQFNRDLTPMVSAWSEARALSIP